MNDLILKYRKDVQEEKIKDSKWTRLSFAKYLMQHKRYFDAIKELNKALEIQEQKEVDKEIYQCLVNLYYQTKSYKAMKRVIDVAAAANVSLKSIHRFPTPAPANKICVYAIAKNEQQFVDRWYESMKEADEIVVLDTGSSDSTVEKLRAHGVIVKVKEIVPWRFDQARNESLALVPDDCNILVCTDLDEVLQPGWAKALRDNWVQGKTKRVYYKYTWSHLKDGSQGRTFTYDKIHSKGWFWKYPVHEMLWFPDNDWGDAGKDQTINLSNLIHLHHYPDQSKSRGSYLPLLELRAKENLQDWYGLIYLAHEYYYRKFYQKSIDLLQKILSDYKDHYSKLQQASCYLFIGDNYMALKKPNKAEFNYIQAIMIDETYRQPYLGLAKSRLELKAYDLAIQNIEDAIKKSYRHYTWLERDTSWTWQPYDLLCLACYYGGDKVNSALYAAKALEYEPTNERLKNNLKLCLQAIETIV